MRKFCMSKYGRPACHSHSNSLKIARIESEFHHDRAALAGLICEFAHRQDVDQILRMSDGHVTAD